MRSRDRNVEPKCIDAPRTVGLDNKQTNKNYERNYEKNYERAHETQPPITAPPIEGPRSAAACEHRKPRLGPSTELN